MNEPESVKVVLLGESGVGKTSIINQFIRKKFNSRITPSINAQFSSKIIEFKEFEKSIKFDIWDTVGQEKFRSITKIFYRDAKVIVLVYDITQEFSFDSLKDYWYPEVINTTEGEPLFAIVANKNDLYEEQKVDDKDGREFADEINAIFQTTSALSNAGINTLFENIGKKIIMPNYDYKVNDKQAQENFKRKNEEKNDSNKNKVNKGVKLAKDEEGNNGKQKKGCC